MKDPRLQTPPSAWRPLLLLGGAELACLAALAWWPGAVEHDGTRILLFFGSYAAYAAAGFGVKDARGGTFLIWTVAIALRLVFLPAPPVLSHEVYRYLWDGHVQLGGFNPLRVAPTDVEVAGLRTGWFALLPDPSSPSTHPPLAQIAFLALSAVGGAVLQAKLLWLGLDLGTGWLLGRIAFLSGRSRRLTQLLYLWSPLLVVEVAWNGHVVPLALFWIALVILLARAPVSAGVAGGLASMAAPVLLAAAPSLALRRPRWGFAVGFVGGALAALLAYASAGRGLLRSLAGPLTGEGFLGGPFLLLESALPGHALPRVVAATAVVGVGLWAASRRFRPERTLLWVTGAALLVTPVLDPCYALWVLPLATLRASRPWLLFTGLAFLAYAGWNAAQPGAPLAQPIWAQLTVWLPLLALLGLEARRTSRGYPLSTSPPQPL